MGIILEVNCAADRITRSSPVRDAKGAACDERTVRSRELIIGDVHARPYALEALMPRIAQQTIDIVLAGNHERSMITTTTRC